MDVPNCALRSATLVCGIALSLFSCAASVADFTIVSGVRGKTAVLPCAIDIRDPELFVQWYDRDMVHISTRYEVFDRNKFEMTFTYPGTWDLQVKQVAQTDQGNYSCKISVVPPQERIVQLSVVEAPGFVSKSPDQRLNTGGAMVLSCAFSGVPVPVVRWFHHTYTGERVDLKYAGVTFRVASVSRHDAGVYECLADNNIRPPYPAYITVNVTFVPEVVVPYREVALRSSAETLLTCAVLAYPVTRLYWMRGGSPGNAGGAELPNGTKYWTHVWPVGAGPRYMLGLGVREPGGADYGDYRCVVQNEFGSADGIITVTEFQPGETRMVSAPKDAVVTAGDGVQLDCAVGGLSPGDTVTWWRRTAPPSSPFQRIFLSPPWSGGASGAGGDYDAGKFEVRGVYSLYLRRATLGDGGTYVCGVTGLQNMSAELTVTGSISCDADDAVLDSGQTASLLCCLPYNGPAPDWRVEWSHDAALVSSMTADTESRVGRALSFVAWYPSSAGVYRCTASSRRPAFELSCTTNITVLRSNATAEQLPVCQGQPMSTTALIVLVILLAVCVIVSIIVIGCVVTYYKRRLHREARFSGISNINGDPTEMKLVSA